MDLKENMMFRISFQVNVLTGKLRYKKKGLHNRKDQTQAKIKLDRKKWFSNTCWIWERREMNMKLVQKCFIVMSLAAASSSFILFYPTLVSSLFSSCLLLHNLANSMITEENTAEMQSILCPCTQFTFQTSQIPGPLLCWGWSPAKHI